MSASSTAIALVPPQPSKPSEKPGDNPGLRLSTEGDVFVKVEIIEPGFHIFEGLAQPADALGKELQRLHVTVPTALAVEGAPMLNLPHLALMWRVFLHPGQDLTVATSFGEFSFQRYWSDAGEPKPMPVHRV